MVKIYKATILRNLGCDDWPCGIFSNESEAEIGILSVLIEKINENFIDFKDKCKDEIIIKSIDEYVDGEEYFTDDEVIGKYLLDKLKSCDLSLDDICEDFISGYNYEWDFKIEKIELDSARNDNNWMYD
jgi:hypothetical protein